MVELSMGEGTTVVVEEGQAALPLVLVPFEAVPEEEAQALRKQATKTKRLQVVAVAQDVLCVASERLGQMEGTTGEASGSEAGHTDEEASSVI